MEIFFFGGLNNFLLIEFNEETFEVEGFGEVRFETVKVADSFFFLFVVAFLIGLRIGDLIFGGTLKVKVRTQLKFFFHKFLTIPTLYVDDFFGCDSIFEVTG